GRDSGRLVPLTIDGTEPPLGFRQYQTINLSRWSGRGTPPNLQTILAAVEALELSGDQTDSKAPPSERVASGNSVRRPRLIGVIAAISVAIVGLSLAFWPPSNRAELAVVAVRAADKNAASQA